MFPMALVCGNTMVLKPSERNPGAVMFIMKLAQEAGIPDGCINVFHGTIERMYPSLNNMILYSVNVCSNGNQSLKTLVAFLTLIKSILIRI